MRKTVFIRILAAACLCIFFLVAARSQVYRRSYTVCILPFTPATPALQGAARELHTRLLDRLKTYPFFRVITLAEVRTVFPEINNSSDWELTRMRKRLWEKLHPHVILTGELNSGTGGTFKARWLLDTIHSGDALTRGNMHSIRDMDTLSRHLFHSLKDRRSQLYQFIPEQPVYTLPAAELRKQPRIYTILVMPFPDKTGRIGTAQRRLFDELQEEIKTPGFLRLIPWKDVLRKVPEFKKATALTPALRQLLYEKMPGIQLVLSGTLDEDDDKQTLEYRTTVLHSGKILGNARSSGSVSGMNTGFNTAQRICTSLSYLKNSLAYHIPGTQAFSRSADDATIDTKTVWTICVPPFTVKGNGLEMVARQAWDAVPGKLAATGYLRHLPFGEVRKIFPAVKTGSDLTAPMIKTLHEKLKIDFVVLGTLEFNPHQGISRYKFSSIEVIAHSRKPFYSTLMTSAPDGVAADIARQFTGLRKKMAAIPFHRENQKHNMWTRAWEKILTPLKRSGKFEYPQPHESGTMIAVTTASPTYPYWLHRPPDYGKKGYSWPLLVFLHGASNKSDTLNASMLPVSPLSTLLQYRAGKPDINHARLKYINKYLKGSFVLMPQTPDGREIAWESDKLAEIIIDVCREYPVDPARVYVVGLSMGGTGTWTLGKLLHSKVAALVPMCCANPFPIDPKSHYFTAPPALQEMPIWAFHAYDDRVLDVGHTAVVLEYLIPGIIFPSDRDIMATYPNRNGDKRLAADDDYTMSFPRGLPGPWEKGVVYPKSSITFTVYRTGGHDAWTATYANPRFWEWLYNQRRTP